MPERKPQHASRYRSSDLEYVRATCLYVATRLGDMMDDLVVVGGLVPSLLIDQAALPEGEMTHAGTLDLDVGLALALLDQGRYRSLTGRLRDAGFSMDRNEQDRPTRQRWKITSPQVVAMDFLIPPSTAADKGGDLRNIEADFAAIISPGLKLAFRDCSKVRIEGRTILGENANRVVSVCGPGAFVVLKALAFANRGEPKDAYDLYYLIRNFGAGVEDIVARLEPLLEDPDAQSAIEILRRDFVDHDGIGPLRVASFIEGGRNDDIQADVVGLVSQLLRSIKPEASGQ